MVARSDDWRADLDWVRSAGRDGLILFEAVGFGPLQDDLRSQGFNVIGGSALGDRLENDRSFALDLLASLACKPRRRSSSPTLGKRSPILRTAHGAACSS
jgi:phosphoribosylamine--glycine ligase